MERYDLEVYNNNFSSKSDIRKFLEDMLNPLENRLIRSGTRLSVGKISSGNTTAIGDIEGFMRLIWGIASDDSLSKDHHWWQLIRRGLINGTDPSHPDYFGDVPDYDQRLVEMASVGYAMTLRPDAIYEPLNDVHKKNLIAWLDQVNVSEAHDCNWKFFRVMVDIGFACNGIAYDKVALEGYLGDLDTYYVGDGWYRDGDINNAHVDYYGPFAMHYYGLFYAKYMPNRDEDRAKRYIDRAVEFSKDFIYWHDKSGGMLHYGRSLTYRFAEAAFWSMIVTLDIELPWKTSQIKGLILRHFRWWHQWPIYDSNGCLTVGYTYPNQFMSEDYNASGSVYWALKIMVILTLPDDHDFWKMEEEKMPMLDTSKVLETPRMIITRDDASSHVLAYTGGSYHTNGHTHVECKYEKFVYSTHFGFSVPRSYKGLNFGAYDNTLAVSEDDRYYRHKEKSEEIEITNDRIRTVWKPYEDVTIETLLICHFPWHIRIHNIKSERPLVVADGGFAIGREPMKNGEQRHHDYRINADGVYGSTEYDYSCIVNGKGFLQYEMVMSSSNTNLMNPRTMIPTLKASLQPGSHQLISYVIGDQGTLFGDDSNVLSNEKIEALIAKAVQAMKPILE